MQTPYSRRPSSFPLTEVDLLHADRATLGAISRELGLALSLGEMQKVRDYFRAAGRNPTDVELQSLGQAWSEHCCYKSSRVFLKEFIFPVQTPDVLDRGDAGVLSFDDEYAYALRIESHNHPSAVEPYGGATTGIGGILRDILAMGAQPIALVDPLHFGPLDWPYERLPPGLKHPKYLFSGVVAGIRDYGNRVGIPTVAGGIVFDPGYVGNIVVNVGCVGFARKDRLLRNRVGDVGDVFLLCGGRTGRDGIHGVTYASAELTGTAVGKWETGAVQLGDPILKEPLIHACLEAAKRGLVRGLKDLGGGGLSCAVGEMALAASFGAEVDLDAVPLKEPGLAPWEIWVSESQERMLLAVAPENVDEVRSIFDLYDVLATPIGRVISDPVARVRFQGEPVLEMDLKFYTQGPEYCRPFREEPPVAPESAPLPRMPEDLAAVWLNILAAPNVCSKELVIRQYDHEVRASTVLKPMQGVVGKAGHGDAAVVKPRVDSWRGLAITTASTPQFTSPNPFLGGANAVDEVCRNLVAVGATPHALTNCLNFGNPERPDRLWSLREAMRGIASVASAMSLAIPSGNVSLYNESDRGAVPPTPVVLGVGIVEDIRRCVTTDLKAEGDPVYLVGETREELRGSEYARLLGFQGTSVPDVRPESLRLACDSLLAANRSGCLAAAHDLSHGGLAVAAAEMAIGGDLGLNLSLDDLPGLRSDILLFSESATRWLVEVRRGREPDFRKLMGRVPTVRLGEVQGREVSLAHGEGVVSSDVDALRARWSSTLPAQVVA